MCRSRPCAPISIHALREEGDAKTLIRAGWIDEFLSTPSARRATVHGLEKALSQKISIHALREEGDHRPPQGDQDDGISIHALREEGDTLF